jgi:dATP pyrophosphohydrolase
MARILSDFVEVCLYRREGEELRFLILRRSDDETLYPGLWQHVTGSIEEAETAVDAARREVREETGFVPDHLWVVPFVNAFYNPEKDAISLTPFFAAEVGSGLEPILSGEHSAFAWLPFEAAMERLIWPGQKRGMELVRDEIVRTIMSRR